MAQWALEQGAMALQSAQAVGKVCGLEADACLFAVLCCVVLFIVLFVVLLCCLLCCILCFFVEYGGMVWQPAMHWASGSYAGRWQALNTSSS
jgi:hypothetical protein